MIRNIGLDAEQICFSFVDKKGKTLKNKLKEVQKAKGVKKITRAVFAVMYFFFRTGLIVYYKINNQTKKLFTYKLRYRYKTVSNFRNSIPHSKKVYNANTIEEAVKEYDAFITGSDQVWNPKWYYPAYMLSFVPKDIPKISYAASLSVNELSEGQKLRFKKDLIDYKAISVREKNATELLENIAPVPVEWVLDPTLLLSKEEWEEICSDRIIECDYIFCYFLGHDKAQRRLVKEFARKNKLKIVTLPYLVGGFNKSDVFFGNEKLYDVSPPDFISLIKHAKYVFTDSFHATVFSCIYDRSFFVFGRMGFDGMSSRIDSLLEMFDAKERFCNTTDRFTLKYIESLNLIIKLDTKKLEEMKEKSLHFLQNALQK